jgi:hypothetical protein
MSIKPLHDAEGACRIALSNVDHALIVAVLGVSAACCNTFCMINNGERSRRI